MNEILKCECACCERIKEINNYKSEYIDSQAKISIIDTHYTKGKRKIPKNIKGTCSYKSFIPKYCPMCGNKLKE